MLDAGDVDVATTDHAGNTMLAVAAQNGHKRICKLCLRLAQEPVAMLNRQNLAGNTAMHYAFQYGFDQLGEYLISKGGNDAVVNNRGLSCRQGTEEGSAAAPDGQQQQQHHHHHHPPPPPAAGQQPEGATYAI